MILELIQTHVIDKQEDLLVMLQNAGYKVTQATVSRDVKELQLVKAPDENGVMRYLAPLTEEVGREVDYHDIFRGAVLAIDSASNDVVIKCRTGMAQAACAALDSMEFASIVGTLAGDDTIFVITRGETQAQALVRDLLRTMRGR